MAASSVLTSAESWFQAEQAEREAAQMAECTFHPRLLARASRREAHAGSHSDAAAAAAAGAPVLVRGLNRHLELQVRRISADVTP